MEEERKWEELNRDLLVEIFERVGIISLSCSIPLVCKLWYHASLVPKCWETLVFPNYFGPLCRILDFSDDYCSNEFVKFVVDRSQGLATHVEFQCQCPEQGLVYISERCPSLKTLYMCRFGVFDDCALTSDLICKWKKLEFLRFSGSIQNLNSILESISIYCKNFVGLECLSNYIGETTSATIVEFIPKIKYLNMKNSNLKRKALVNILKGCRELESLDVSCCLGFDAHDTEILELASHIPSFNCDGSSFCDPDDWYMDSDGSSFYDSDDWYMDNDLGLDIYYDGYYS